MDPTRPNVNRQSGLQNGCRTQAMKTGKTMRTMQTMATVAED
jgi:hypothetical protein